MNVMRKYFIIFMYTFSLITDIFGQKEELQPYISFLEKQDTDPVDYVFNLFEKYDIVIMGERDHRDTTQYELINKIISDPRFSENIGHIFTEVGVYNQMDNLNKVLKGEYLVYTDFEEALKKVYVNMDYSIVWEKYNYWMLLQNIYKVNMYLSGGKKLTIHPTDVIFDWSQCKTHSQWEKFMDNISNSQMWDRDSIMGENFIKGYDAILQNRFEKRKKALVIFNRPHSYQNYQTHSGYWLNSAASFIFLKYPQRVANIMINWVAFQNSDKDWLVATGKWDAAFRYIKNTPLGFDFKGSPFGVDCFDHYSKPLQNLQYKDIYTGFIFYKPIEEWQLVCGIPNIITEKFMPEFQRRIRIVNPNINKKVINEIYKELNYFDIDTVYRKDTPKERVNKYINYWLE